METLVGTVNRIVFESKDNDFKVFHLKRKDRANFTVTGDFPNLITGAKIEVHGKFQTHPRYGTGFKCEAHSFDYENNTKSIYLYLQSIAKWIGPERSLTIAKHFESDLEEVIENQPERLTEVEGIGEKIALSIAEAWDLNKNLKNVRIFLHSLGLTTYKIKKIVTMFGPETEEILKDNPWLLCFKGFGFTTCDYIADKLEKDMKCAERFRFYALHALKESLNSGHLYLMPNELLASYNRYNKKTPYQFKKGEIDVNDVAPHIKYLKDEGYIILDNNRIYEINNFFYESESARLLKKTLETESSCKLDHQNIKKFIKEYEKQEGYTLADTQKDAIESFIKEKVMIITGSPGTGKTSIVKALVQILKKNNITFELLTPTGIAAKKLGKTAGCTAYTIHRRLGYQGDKWSRNALAKYNTQVVIVDETSMVDMEVFYRLISALHSNTKLVFVGDNDQLPSVGPGSVLKDLIKSNQIKSIFLNIIFRQDECSDIIKESKKIRDGDTDLSLFQRDKNADIWHIPYQDPTQIEATIVKFAQMIKDSNKKRAKKDQKYFQIITPRNQGPCSVDSLNKALQEALNSAADNKKELRLKYMTIRKGDRIIIKKNNYDLDVYNGDIGKVAFITPERVTVDVEDFDDQHKRVEIPVQFADDMIKLAYSITVHKCAPGYNRVQTKEGLKKLSDIKEGDQVITRSGKLNKVKWAGFVGNKDNYRVSTNTGLQIDSSKEHKHLIANETGLEYKQVKNIVEGDYLCSHKSMDIDKCAHTEMANKGIFFELPAEIKNISKDDLYFNKIISVEKIGKEKMWDIEVEEDHSYIMEGIITHNSQGLEYPLVIIPFIKAHGALLLQRNLLYTAITRAKKKVVIIGQASAIEKAILNDKIQRRNTLFSERLNKWITGQGISLRDMFSNPSDFHNSKNLEQLLSLEGQA